MGIFSPLLNKRCHIQQVVKTASGVNDWTFTESPLKTEFETILSIWCYVKQPSTNYFIEAIRNVNVGDQTYTHEIMVRHASVRGLGAVYSAAFDTDFDSIADINSLKSEYYVLLEKDGSAVKGRRLKIMNTRLDEMNREYVIITCSENEEVGTGYKA